MNATIVGYEELTARLNSRGVMQRIDKFQATLGSQLCSQVKGFGIMLLDRQKIVHSEKCFETRSKCHISGLIRPHQCLGNRGIPGVADD